jgi:hypothetical protein
MTVRINKPALNLREELTKAQGVVRYEQRQFWMDGLVENGAFDTTDGWTLGTGWSISGGSANSSGSGGHLEQIGKIEKSKRYMVAVDIDYTSGSGQIYVGGVLTSLSVQTTGQQVDFVTPVATEGFVLLTTNYIASVNEVKLFEVDENDNVIHSLPLGFKPLHVYEDGLIQREGDVHDYTVVKTGGAYAIKPTVQPTATTETCVIAEREL